MQKKVDKLVGAFNQMDRLKIDKNRKRLIELDEQVKELMSMINSVDNHVRGALKDKHEAFIDLLHRVQKLERKCQSWGQTS